MTEYLILRGTGYDPTVVPYDAVFALIKRLDDLIDKDISPEVNEEAMTVLKAVTASLVYPVKEARSAFSRSEVEQEAVFGDKVDERYYRPDDQYEP